MQINITVIIPCFRAGRYLIEAVDSVLSQSGDFSFQEILVVDDRSDDEETKQAYEVVQKRSSLIRILQNTGPKGSGSSRNVGIEAAKGNWIIFIDADDYLTANSVQARCKVLLQHPTVQWCGGDFVNLHEDGTLDERGRFETKLASYPFLKAAYESNAQSCLLPTPAKFFLMQVPLNMGTFMISRDLLLKIGGFDPSLTMQQDYHLFLRLARIANFAYTTHKVMVYRQHATNITKSPIRTQTWRIVALKKLVAHEDFLSFRQEIWNRIAMLHLSNSYEFRKERQFCAATREAFRSLVVDAKSTESWRCLAASILRRS
jgi:glycosyltransferase involved in cell wall biosynthesis